jgi:hypothetical protein
VFEGSAGYKAAADEEGGSVQSIYRRLGLSNMMAPFLWAGIYPRQTALGSGVSVR